jgi:hypothetical protein
MGGLTRVYRKHLPPLVIAARRTGSVTADTGATLRTLRKFRSMPAIGCLARPEAHFRGFTFWHSHKESVLLVFSFFSLQAIQNAPWRGPRRLGDIGGRL